MPESHTPVDIFVLSLIKLKSVFPLGELLHPTKTDKRVQMSRKLKQWFSETNVSIIVRVMMRCVLTECLCGHAGWRWFQGAHRRAAAGGAGPRGVPADLRRLGTEREVRSERLAKTQLPEKKTFREDLQLLNCSLSRKGRCRRKQMPEGNT